RGWIPTLCANLRASDSSTSGEHLPRPYGTCPANPHRDCRLVVQGLGRNSVPAGSDAQENPSRRVSRAILRRRRNQLLVLRTHSPRTRPPLVAEGGGQPKFSFYREAAPLVYALSA